MSTVDIKTTELNVPSNSIPPYASQMDIGKIINSLGSANIMDSISSLSNKAKTEVLNQASSMWTGGNVSGSLTSLSSMLPGSSMIGSALDNASGGALSNFSNITMNVTPGSGGSTGSSQEGSDKSMYGNPYFTKMNKENTDQDSEYANMATGLIEKRDSPVRLEVGDEKIDKFFLTQVNYEMKEKVQMMAMLDSSDIIYFFGDNPIIVTFAGICLDTYNFQWLKAITDLYKNKMRGTLSVSSAMPVKIYYDDEILEGVIINMNTGKSAASLNNAEVRFTMVITDTMSTALNAPKSVTTGVTAEDITTEAKGSIANRAVQSTLSMATGGMYPTNVFKSTGATMDYAGKTSSTTLINTAASKSEDKRWVLEH